MTDSIRLIDESSVHRIHSTKPIGKLHKGNDHSFKFNIMRGQIPNQPRPFARCISSGSKNSNSGASPAGNTAAFARVPHFQETIQSFLGTGAYDVDRYKELIYHSKKLQKVLGKYLAIFSQSSPKLQNHLKFQWPTSSWRLPVRNLLDLTQKASVIIQGRVSQIYQTNQDTDKWCHNSNKCKVRRSGQVRK